jgi:hypothetical protein
MRNDQAAVSDIDFRHRRRIERQQFGPRTARRPQLDQVAGAEIMDRNHRAAFSAGAIDGTQSDQIGVVKFIGIRRLRQTLARHIELDIGKPLGGIAVINSGQLGDKAMLGRPQALNPENAPILGLKWTVGRNRSRLGGKRLQPDFAAHAMWGADLSEIDARARHDDSSPSLTRRRGVGRC